MSAQSPNSDQVKAQIRLLQNPYASLSMQEDEAEDAPREVTLEQKRAYFRKLENPYAYHAIFDEPEEQLRQLPNKVATQGTLPLIDEAYNAPVQLQDSVVTKEELDGLLDDVLLLYKPYVARNEWERVTAYRSSFLSEANKTAEMRARVASRLKKLKFSLVPGEKVEHNRAPAERILGELKRVLA